LEIAWEQYTNDKISEALRKWVKLNRPKDIPKPDTRGKTRKEIHRAALRNLGVMRLMNFCTVANLKYRCPAAARYFKGVGWLGTEREKDFSAARKHALKTFHDFFPGLPEGELPLSARTKAGRAKL